MPTGLASRSGVALLVGVGNYTLDSIPSLRFTASDVRALASALVDPALCNFPADKVVALTDSEANRDSIVQRLSRWLPEQARNAEIVFLYFAGHGMLHSLGGQEEGYLLAHDSDPDDLATRGVAMADLARWVRALQARTIVVCLDCCHAGKLVHGGNARGGAARDMRLRPQLLAELTGRGRFLIASCDENQKSFESPELNHGIFTYHLLNGLRGAGDQNRDGKVGVAELFNYVSAEVPRTARQLFSAEQTPWTSATWADEVYLSAPGDVIEARPIESAGTKVIMPVRRDTLRLSLQQLKPDSPAEDWIPLFGAMTHESADMRREAKLALQNLGLARLSRAAVDLVRTNADLHAGIVLDGIAKAEAHPELIALLNQLTALLRGDWHHRAVLLYERKILSLGSEQVERLFQSIRSNFQIQKVLGQGLATASYLAHDANTELDVVVRVLRPELASQPRARNLFLQLARQSVRCVHQNLVMTREVREFPEQSLYFAVRDYQAGVTVHEAITGGKSFLPAQIVSLVRQMLSGLTPFHERNLVHGAVKPTNLFLNGGERVLLGDASPAPHDLGLSLPRLAYDYRYSAPESFLGTATPLADLYSVGCVAHELLCGEPPFVADSPLMLPHLHLSGQRMPLRDRQPNAPRGLTDFISRLLARNVSDRFRDLESALRALDALGQEKAPPLLQEASLMDYQPNFSVLSLSIEQPPTVDSEPPAPEAEPPEVELPAVAQTIAPGRPWLRPPDPENSLVVPPTPAEKPPASPMAGTGSQDTFSGVPPMSAMKAPDGFPQIPGYEILGVVGRGGMGVVYRARDLRLERLVAIKMLRHTGHETQRRFQREMRVAAQLQHPNLVPVFDVGELGNDLYLVMPYLGGGTLSQRLRDSGPLSPADAVRLLVPLADAMSYAHQKGMVHRDLKPANILLSEEGAPLIADFGLARLLGGQEYMGSEGPDNRSMSGAILGTPAYMSPEQAQGNQDEIAPATDIYGLGALLFEVLTGQPPFRGPNLLEVLFQVVSQPPPSPRALVPSIPGRLDRIVVKCLQKEPRQRFASAAALAQELRNCVEIPTSATFPAVPLPSSARLRTDPETVASRVVGEQAGFWQRVRRWFGGR